MLDAMGPDQRRLWGLVLAAGDGRRMERHILDLKGETLPKQYVNFVGRRSMLEHTFHRVAKIIPDEQILTVVSEKHLVHAEVSRQLNKRPKATVIVQPKNKDTGPGILLPLMFLHKRCPEAIVALFPSDHFILEEERFMNYVRLAGRAVDHNPSCIVLLAVEAHEPEIEYGYILPRQEVAGLNGFGARHVAGFVEKPCPQLALELMLAGGLWNTMTMVFKLKTLLELVGMFYPEIYESFCHIHEAIGTPRERSTISKIYELLEPINFSKGLLEKVASRQPDTISVLPVRKVYWSDWGSAQRITRVLEALYEPRGEGKLLRRQIGDIDETSPRKIATLSTNSTVVGQA